MSVVDRRQANCGFIRVAVTALTLAGAVATAPAFAKPADSFRAYVNGRWGQIHVRVDGPANGPTVILVHKMVWSSVEFSKAQPYLAARGVRSIAVDLPGYGLSDSPSAQPGADDYADDLVPILNHFKVLRPVMVGVNTGATLVVAFALRHPDRTSAIVLDGPPIYDGEALKHYLAEPFFDRTARPDGATLLARWKDVASFGTSGSLSDEAIQTGLLQFFEAGPHYLFGHQAIFRYPLKAQIDKVTVPVMLLTYPGDQLFAVSLAVKKSHPGYTLTQIGWTGMTADFQAPESWANAVADYVLKRRS
jgi:pimeloyl-ACP methyl ester carboxylesterase